MKRAFLLGFLLGLLTVWALFQYVVLSYSNHDKPA